MSERARIISTNDLHVIMGSLMNAANEVHISMCLFNEEHKAQSHLNMAMQAILSGVEQCRQLHKSAKVRIAEVGNDEQEPTR